MKQRSGVVTLVIAVALAIGIGWSAPAGADPESTVTIRIVKNNAGGREIEVKNRGVGLCRNGKCSGEITWEWKRKDELPGQKIVIEFSGGTTNADQCFDKKRYEIDDSNKAVKASLSGNCPIGKAAWFYDIKCEKDGNPCAGIAPVDPGVIIDG